MKVNLTDIIDAIEMTDQFTENFLDLETGEVIFTNEMIMDSSEIEDLSEQLESHGFVRLPSSYDIREYDIMVDFIATLPDAISKYLDHTISGRGAFRIFKDGIRQFGIEDDWFQYQEKAYKEIAIRWCKENGLEIEQ